MAKICAIFFVQRNLFVALQSFLAGSEQKVSEGVIYEPDQSGWFR